MATREENLKKINDELEKLDDEQLEQVAGGIFRIKYNKDTDNYQNTPANHWDLSFNQTPNTANAQNTPANQLGALPSSVF